MGFGKRTFYWQDVIRNWARRIFWTLRGCLSYLYAVRCRNSSTQVVLKEAVFLFVTCRPCANIHICFLRDSVRARRYPIFSSAIPGDAPITRTTFTPGEGDRRSSPPHPPFLSSIILQTPNRPFLRSMPGESLVPGYKLVETFGPDSEYEARPPVDAGNEDEEEVEEEVEYVTLEISGIADVDPNLLTSYRLIVSFQCLTRPSLLSDSLRVLSSILEESNRLILIRSPCFPARATRSIHVHIGCGHADAVPSTIKFRNDLQGSSSQTSRH